MKTFFTVLFFLLSFSSSFAHESIANTGGGLVSGLLHPVFGLDHLFAMVSVGIVSAYIGGRAIWTIPLSFVSCMLIGGLVGIYYIGIVPYLELGIGFSVFLLGLSIALQKKGPVVLSLIIVGFFGFFHGYAHGIEMPFLPSPILYFLGFLISTVFLHVTGIMISIFIKPFKYQKYIFSFLGSFITLCGVYFIVY